ncbi:PREDICTED: lipopolysaccharide-induced tumor necrosis factor-alpha factor homolog isoform X2 [Dinoponera quadriceps]|uniref:Lipopolysaccharide-induced tumor necrosis factor-alpha factor homolog isoform X2 n=1 Tax=Dinoponera quadriceps TaxID=609295 RepID=A0A6P3XFK8_DINQU|nr:PREDICTED: lipopolysaccharide-induced tumor necrosis factor-alpha factor homolog isoform X2 [Dinoponera quadriceps]
MLKLKGLTWQHPRWIRPSLCPVNQFPTSARSSWPRVPTTAICPRCAGLIITTVIVRRSTYTHLTALTLFLFGCWPCCMLPYCIDSCNNTDHYCPLCHAHLGTYAPWSSRPEDDLERRQREARRGG